MENAKSSRTSKTVFNAVTSIGGYAITIILGFVGRSIFLRYLAVELLGVNGLFASILQIFSLAELGFATAVAYALYKPLSESDERKIAILMRYYAKIYAIIGSIVLVLGLILLPFLQNLINEFEEINISINELRLYYVIFLASTVSTYFIAYKRTLIISDQKKYIANFVNIGISILSRTLQILIIVLLKSFTIYLTVQVVATYIENIIISVIVNARYKYLKQYKNEKLSADEKKSLYSNIGALFVAKASSVFTTGIISIIISKMIGLGEVGLYSNYVLLTASITAVLALIFESATASVGNFAVTENKDSQKKLFKNILYFNSFFAALFFAGMTVLLNDFIGIWLGEEMIFDKWLPIVMSVNMFIWIMRNTSWIFYNAYGLYKHFFYRSFFEIAVFLGLAFPGAIFFGVTGVVAAQIIAVVATQIPFEVFVVSKYVLFEKTKFYYLFLLKYCIITAISLGLSIFVCYFIPLSGIAGFIIKTAIIIVVVVAVYLLATFKSEEYKFYADVLARRLKKKKNIVHEMSEQKLIVGTDGKYFSSEITEGKSMYKICTRCIMTDKGDTTITFDEKGICSYCTKALKSKPYEYFSDEEGKRKLDKRLTEIKSNRAKEKFDCMMGISGGLDSSYLLYLGYQWRLRILAIHIDDGFDTELAKENIRKLSEACNVELIIIKPDETEFNDLTLSFIKASVPNIAIPQDNVLTAILYEYALQNNINYFLSGSNYALESILQKGNTYANDDKKHILDIQKKFGTVKIKNLPLISFNKKRKIRKKLHIETLMPLNYINYNKENAIKELGEFCGYQYYEAKHYESIFTRFLQTYYLPVKFTVDKRTSHLSSLIVSGQMTREQALAEMEKPLIREELLKSDIDYITNRLGVSSEEFGALMKLQPKQHLDYKTDKFLRNIYSILTGIKRRLRLK